MEPNFDKPQNEEKAQEQSLEDILQEKNEALTARNALLQEAIEQAKKESENNE